MMVDYLETLKKLPAGINKNPAYRGKSIKELLATPDLPPMSTTTINKYIERAGSLLIWCMKQEYIDRNPAMGLSIAKTTKDDEQRSVYSIADLELIQKLLPSVDTAKPERYWIPRIAMYSGLRLNEICQLYVDDVVEVDSIWCFDVNGDKDKRIKNLASRRIVPVHPKLIDSGLLDYIEGMKKTGAPRVWMNLVKGRDGHSHDYGHWFSRFNRSKITTDPLKVFHSLRHTLADTLKQAGVAEGVISEILGHSNASITTGRYGKRFRPQVLLDALVKLTY
jgi:integrase